MFQSGALVIGTGANGAIIVGNTTVERGINPTAIVTTANHTVGSNANRLLVVTVAGEASDITAESDHGSFIR